MSRHNASYKLSATKEGSMKLDTLEAKDLGGSSFRELEAIEYHRREILKRVEEPVWRILIHWSGTCLRALVVDGMVWIPIFIYLLIRYQARQGGEEPAMAKQLRDTGNSKEEDGLLSLSSHQARRSSFFIRFSSFRPRHTGWLPFFPLGAFRESNKFTIV